MKAFPQKGASNKEIANRLNITEAAVKSHLNKVWLKTMGEEEGAHKRSDGNGNVQGKHDEGACSSARLAGRLRGMLCSRAGARVCATVCQAAD
jgi:Bacterial regulatory proteins, luxR family